MSTRTAEFDVNSEVLKWARINAGLKELQEAEKRTKISAEDLSSWENGSAKPSFADLKKIAESYKTPLAVFFLSEPPTSDAKPKDFRTIGSKDHKEISFKTTL